MTGFLRIFIFSYSSPTYIETQFIDRIWGTLEM